MKIMKIPSTKKQISNKSQCPKFKIPNKGFVYNCANGIITDRHGYAGRWDSTVVIVLIIGY